MILCFASCLSFPFKLIYHFLPWPLLVILLFKKENWEVIRSHEILMVFGVFFLANIWVYWVSPNIFPRYLIMFMPIFLAPLFKVYFELNHSNNRLVSILHKILLGCLVLGLIATTLPMVLPYYSYIDQLYLKIIPIVLLMSGTVYYFMKCPSN